MAGLPARHALRSAGGMDRRRHHHRHGRAGVQRGRVGRHEHRRAAGGLVRPGRDPLHRPRAAGRLRLARHRLAAARARQSGGGPPPDRAPPLRARLDARAGRRAAHRRHGLEHHVVAGVHGDRRRRHRARPARPARRAGAHGARRSGGRRGERTRIARQRLDMGLHRHAVRHPPGPNGLRPVTPRHQLAAGRRRRRCVSGSGDRLRASSSRCVSCSAGSPAVSSAGRGGGAWPPSAGTTGAGVQCGPCSRVASASRCGCGARAIRPGPRSAGGCRSGSRGRPSSPPSSPCSA